MIKMMCCRLRETSFVIVFRITGPEKALQEMPAAEKETMYETMFIDPVIHVIYAAGSVRQSGGRFTGNRSE